MSRGPLPAVLLVLQLFGAGCSEPSSSEAADSPTPRQTRPGEDEERQLLRNALNQDRTLEALEAVEDASAQDLPVRAAGILRESVLPAVDQTIDEIRALEFSIPVVQQRQDRALALLQDRRDALRDYARALDRGLVEDMELLDALSAQRSAEEAFGAFLSEL